MQAAAASTMTKFPAAAQAMIWLKVSRLEKGHLHAAASAPTLVNGRSEDPALYVETLFDSFEF
jgi:hypothetical protein